MSITRRLLQPHLKTLWWWQRRRVLNLVSTCLEAYHEGDEARFYELINSLTGKPKQILLLCLRDCLRYVQFTGDQILEALERS